MGGMFDNFWLYFIFGYIFDPFLCFLLFHRAGSLSLRVQSAVNALQWLDNERREPSKKVAAEGFVLFLATGFVLFLAAGFVFF